MEAQEQAAAVPARQVLYTYPPGSSLALGAIILGPDAIQHKDIVYSGTYNVLMLDGARTRY